jgi:hypothetical protein
MIALALGLGRRVFDKKLEHVDSLLAVAEE